MYTLRKIPLLRILIPFAVGIFINIKFNLNEQWDWIILFVGPLLYLLYIFSKWRGVYKFRAIPGLAFSLLLIGIGSLLVRMTEVPENDLTSISNRNPQAYWIEVTAPIVKKPSSIQVEAKVVSEKYDKPLKGVFYFDKEIKTISRCRIGDLILIHSRLKLPDPPKNPLQFDYQQYLYFQRIYFQTFLKSKNVLEVRHNKGFSIVQLSSDVRSFIVGKMKQAGLSGDELGIAGALVIGEEGNISPEIRSAYSASGSMHVLSVSGLHIGIVFIMLKFLLQPFLKKAKWKAWIMPGIVLLLWIYSFITGLSPSVQRATLMFSFVALGDAFGKKANIYNTLGASAIFLLVIEPYLLMDVGFQLSYLALLGILIFQPPITKLIYVKNEWLFKVWELTAVAIAAQLTTGALSIYYFHQFPNFFLIANLLVIPLSFIILIIGVSFILLCWIPGVDLVLGFCLKHSTWFMNASLLWMEKLPGSVTKALYLTELDSWVLYVLLIVLTSAIFNRNKYWFAGGLMTFNCWLGLVLFGLLNLPKELRVYNVPRQTVIGVYRNNEREILATNKADLRLAFLVNNHSIAMHSIGIKNWPEESGYIKGLMPVPDGNELLIGRSETALIVKSPPNLKFYPKIHINYLLIESSLFNWKQIRLFAADTVILGNCLEFKVKSKLKRYLEQRKVEVKVMSELDSFVLN